MSNESLTCADRDSIAQIHSTHRGCCVLCDPFFPVTQCTKETHKGKIKRTRCMLLLTTHNSRSYSVLKLFTGLALAAFTV